MADPTDLEDWHEPYTDHKVTKRRKRYPRPVKANLAKREVMPWDGETKHAALVTLLGLIDRGKQLTQAVRAIALRYGVNEGTVWRLIGPYRRKTTVAATRLFQVSAFDLAQKVIAEGSPAELIDVLSRPNIGVLEPVKKVGGEGGSGLFISVQVGSCGGVASVGGSILSASAPKEITDGEVSEGWAGEDGEPQRG